MGDIAKKVNAILGGKSEGKAEKKQKDKSKDKAKGNKRDKKYSTFPYMVKVTSSVIDVRKEPNIKSSVCTTIKKGEVYTIVEERKTDSTVWGKLKSGAGWINLSKTERV